MGIQWGSSGIRQRKQGSSLLGGLAVGIRGDFLRVWTGDLLEYEWGSSGDPQGIRQRKRERGSGLLGGLAVGIF